MKQVEFGEPTTECLVCGAKLEVCRVLKVSIHHAATKMFMGELEYDVPLCQFHASRDENGDMGNCLNISLRWSGTRLIGQTGKK